MQYIRSLTALDGRYHAAVDELRDIFSEYGLIKYRVHVEVQWFRFLSQGLKLFAVPDEKWEAIEKIADRFDLDDAARIKDIEKTTNHDVKAVEYFLKEQFDTLGLKSVMEWLHFSCTSEDINNTAYALMMKEGRGCVEQYLTELLSRCEMLAKEYKSIPMMSRTHGQPATPTTVGKEFVNYAWRLKREMAVLADIRLEAKMNGATGNYNAHYFAFPQIDWIQAGQTFLKEYLQVEPLLYTTQINPNHFIAQTMHVFSRLAAVIIDLDRDMWGYISLGYFKQKLREGEVGSSTMPHKVNPIDFENSEGNAGITIALMEHLAKDL
ncbi:MAG: adenylosuccinate lyase, partial [Candidatus Omnitrophica bacterium]|nr:adenylosuccinate lyase [Candidatus Omnitrophota bacterium]